MNAPTVQPENPCEGVQRELNRLAVHRNGIVGVAGLWASAAFWLLMRAPREPILPYLWPFLFGSVAIFTLAVLSRPESRRFHWWLTMSGLAAVGLRPSVTVARWIILDSSTFADVGFSCTLYALAGFLWIRFSQGSLRAWRYHAIATKASR